MQVLSRRQRMRHRCRGRDARRVFVRSCSESPASTAACAVAWRRVDSASSGPLVPFGQLHGVLLCRHQLRDGRSPMLLRELHPSLDTRRGRCVWRSGPVVCDLSHAWGQIADPLSIKPWQRMLMQYASLLNDAIASVDTPTEPTLPYTVMSLPTQTMVVPRPTPAILRIPNVMAYAGPMPGIV